MELLKPVYIFARVTIKIRRSFFVANTVVIFCGVSTKLVTLQSDYDTVKLHRETPQVSC